MMIQAEHTEFILITVDQGDSSKQSHTMKFLEEKQSGSNTFTTFPEQFYPGISITPINPLAEVTK